MSFAPYSFPRRWAKSLIIGAASKLNLYATERIENHVYVDRSRVMDNSPPRLSLHKNDGFVNLATRVVESGRTLLRFQRLTVLWQAMQNVKHLKLPAAELGAYKGGSAFFIAAGFREICGVELPLHVFDTFRGHPAKTSAQFKETHHKPGLFSDTSYDEVMAFLKEFTKVEIHRGDFTEITNRLPDREYGFVHLDADTFIATSAGLDYFFPRLASGGVIVLDDFGSGKCPGVVAAYKKFMSAAPACLCWQPFTEQCIISKR